QSQDGGQEIAIRHWLGEEAGNSRDTTPGISNAKPRNLNPCSNRIGFRFSGLRSLPSAGQMYSQATAPQAINPNTPLISNKAGSGMSAPASYRAAPSPSKPVSGMRGPTGMYS